MSRIGVVGLGAMGSRVARRLLGARRDVVVWNRSKGPVEELARAGAEPASNPAEVARRTDLVVTMLADPDALRSVSEGEEGLAAGADPETTIAEMSTVGPAAIEELAARLPDGTPLLDAPVLGSLTEVESGTLQVFVGGPREVFDKWAPELEILGTPLHVGPLGSGAAAKLVANSTLFGVLGVLGEALALGDGLGLDRDVTLDVLARSPLGPQVERRRHSIETGEFPVRFRLALAHKDAELVVAAARRAGVDVRLAAAALSWIRAADEEGWSEYDYSSILARIAGTPGPAVRAEP